MALSFALALLFMSATLVASYQTDENGRLRATLIAANHPTTVSFNFAGSSNLLNIMEMLVSMDPELTSIFDTEDAITAFLPYDPAFKKTPLRHLLSKFAKDEWRLHRRDFVLFHLYSGYLDPRQMPFDPLDNHSFTMMNGDVVSLEFKEKKTYVNAESRVLTTGIGGSQRSIFMLQRALPRPWFEETVFDVAHSKFQQLAVIAGIDEELQRSDSITLFLPPPKAFDDFNPSMTQEDLAFLLRFHIVKDKVISNEDLAEPGRMQIKNDAGHTLTIDSMEIVTVDGVKINSRQVLALNGMVHHIDRLLPKGFEPSNTVAEGTVGRDGTAINLSPAGIGEY